MSRNDDIFKYLSPKGNTRLSKLKKNDLQEVLNLLDSYYLPLRKNLNIDNNLTFGFEIEYEFSKNDISNYDLDVMLKKINSKHRAWITAEDASIDHGGEISTPILKDVSVSWWELEQVCSLLKSVAHINNNCGGHIHIGAQILGTKVDNWINFIYLWSVYENIIFRFCYEEYLTERDRIHKYAPPISKYMLREYLKRINKKDHFSNLIDVLDEQRYQAISFENVEESGLFEEYNTIEFRCPNGTLEPVVWQNNLNLFVHLLMYSKNKNIDKDIIKRRYRLEKRYLSDLKYYREINLEQALELSDLIFTKNIDKLYFLKQYLKAFEVGKMCLEPTKTFILKKK